MLNYDTYDLKTKPILYTNGCSVTNGSELFTEDLVTDKKVDSCISWQDLYKQGNIDHALINKCLSFGGLIAQHIDYVHIDNSLPGSSNDGILRRTIEDVNKLLEAHAPADILVIIALTDPERMECVRENDFTSIIPFNFPRDKLLMRYSRFKEDNHVQEFYQNIKKYMMDISHLTLYLESTGVRFLITEALPGTVEIRHGAALVDSLLKYRSLESVFQNIYPNNVFLHNCPPPTTLIEFHQYRRTSNFYGFVSQNRLKILKKRHPGKEAHRLWSRVLIDELGRQDLI